MEEAGADYGIYPLHDDLISENAHLPFPFKEKSQISREQREEWKIEKYSHIPGIIYVSTPGCAGETLLVVTGSNRGFGLVRMG